MSVCKGSDIEEQSARVMDMVLADVQYAVFVPETEYVVLCCGDTQMALEFDPVLQV